MSAPTPLGAFSAYGIEIEYAIVDRASLDVRPIADRLLEDAAGQPTNDYAEGPIAWSNELSLHVIELKTNGPSPSLIGLADEFAAALRRIDGLLAARGARIMPGPMHPWMDPLTEQRIWPHEQNAIYAAYDRIFDCRGHGWANLQSMHINLPFANDDEFVRLHTAIRAVLPLLPALACASPFMDAKATGFMDTRLEVYRRNQRRVPEITGAVIPDCVSSSDEYHARILEPMYAAIAPHDPDGVLRGEWLNSRGAIARFDRDAIEIRVLDAQECPAADLAVAQAVCAVVQDQYEERFAGIAAQGAVETGVLAALFERAVKDGERVQIDNAAVRAALGLPATPLSAQQAWRMLVERSTVRTDDVTGAALDSLLTTGPLARRLVAAAGSTPTRERLRAVYGELCAVLDGGRVFKAG